MRMFDLKGTVLSLSTPNINSLLNSIEMYRGKTLSVDKLKKLDKLQSIARRSSVMSSCRLGNVFLSEQQEKDLFEARALKSKLQNMAAEYEREPVNEVKTERDDTPLKVGDNVYVKSLDKVGVLTRLTPKGDGEVTLGKIHTKVKAGDFYKVKGKK